MILLSIAYGLFLVGLGCLVKRYPDSIAGYNTKKKEDKTKVDIAGLSNMMQRVFIIMGILTTGGYLAFRAFNLPLLATLMLFFPLLTGLMIMTNLAPGYSAVPGKRTKRVLFNLLFLVALGFVSGKLAYSYIPTRTTITQESVSFSGAYGFDIPVRDIEDVDLKARIPAIQLRAKGYALGNVMKGKFRLADYGICNLFLHRAEGPYLIITYKNGAKTIINNPDSLQTENDYYALVKLIDQ